MARALGVLRGLEHEMRRGLADGEFEVHYQPLVHIATRGIVGAEALVRWRSPSRGLITAERFISVAETTGLIIPLGEFVLREACRRTAEWQEAGLLPDEFVTWVNISGKQLSSGGVKKQVERELARSGLPSSRLGLEVTETAVVAEGAAGERAYSELGALRALGVRIAIDDFGTGFSSLGHLRRFPVDVLKVDRSFVQGVGLDARDEAITANLASLAHALGLVAVAEGIESDDQLESVHALGCDHAQGHLLAHPMPGDEMARLIAGESAEPFAATA